MARAHVEPRRSVEAVCWPSKDPDEYVNPNPRFTLRRKERPAELSFRDWKLMSPPLAMTFAGAPLWFGVIYLATWLGGVAMFELETPIFFALIALWLAQFDALRIKGAAARDGVRFPPPRAAAFGSAPWGLLVVVQLASVLAGGALAATTSNDDLQLALVFAGLFLAFPACWLLEWWAGNADRVSVVSEEGAHAGG